MWIKQEVLEAYRQFMQESEEAFWMGTRLTKQQRLARSLKRDSKGRFIARSYTNNLSIMRTNYKVTGRQIELKEYKIWEQI